MGRSGVATADEAAAPTAAPRPRPTVWSLIIDPVGRPGPAQMAVDQALLDAAQRGAASLRLYRWAPPCLSFGRHEPASRRYDRARIEALGLSVVRRPTGGRAVWHDAEVTYAVAAPNDTFGALPRTYQAIHALIAAGLAALGVHAELAEPRAPVAPGAGACFATPAGGEIVVHGRKLVGSAQVREGSAFLQHGSILLEDGQDLVARLTRGAAAAPHGTSLVALLGRRVTFADVASAIATVARRAWEGEWRDATSPAVDPGRFGDPEWTWRR